MRMYDLPDARGHFGPYGGVFVAETLSAALDELRAAYERARNDPAFQAEFKYELKHYVGRPSPIYFAKRLTEKCGGARIYIKREDLNHTGAHKINNTIGQALLARNMKKPRVIAETGDAMHAGAGLGDDARFAHAARKQRLADGVVDLVRAGVVEVLALEVDLRPAQQLRPALGVVHRARAPDVVLQVVAEFRLERGIAARLLIGGEQFLERVRQRLGDERAAVGAEVPARVGQVMHPHS